MTALLDAATRGMARGFVSLAALGLIVWAADKALGRREP
jgi:hypothetical protein